MLLGWRCRDTVYGEYDLDPLREPALSLVFEGVHDGIYPFKDIIESGKRPREEASEDGENVPDGGEAAEDADPEGADPGDAAGTVREGESAAEIAASYEEAGDSAVEKLEALPQNAIRGDADKLPEGVCNPVMQAELLNQAGTDLNVVMGLCVGHDSLFYKYSEALVTTLVAKDRVLAHNPAGALYQAGAYYKKLLK
jgi:hypothetical protein